MVVDKETKMRETLRIMSMRSAAYGLSYFLTQLVFITLIALIMMTTFLVKDFICSSCGPTFIAAMLLNGVSMTFFSMALTTVFSDSKISVQLGSLALVLPLVLFIGLLNIDKTDPWRLYFGYMLPTFPTTVIVADMAESSLNISLPIAWAVLVLQAPMYFLLYVYLDQVMPDTYGISKSCCFCLRRKRASREADRTLSNMQVNTSDISGDLSNRIIAPGEAPVQIHNLCKTFGAFKAVDNLSLKINGDEVFCLLGHNGAGKTTAIQLITGILRPSSGDAVIYGHDLVSDIDGVRQSLGLCQQFDVLFDQLTCKEHLQLVCELKDIEKSIIDREITEILDIVMLREHAEKISKTLSGGMKRKLSLAMALVGHSKLIILDEPTSGLDVESRRQVWELIKKIKRGRSIIMSTQHLEEADELSDRICIMSHGKLLALDTPFNIKKQFGVGYNLYVEPRNDLPAFNAAKAGIDQAVLQGVPGAEESSDSTNKKYIYVIPIGQ